MTEPTIPDELDGILNQAMPYATDDNARAEATAKINKLLIEARIDELKKVGCCDYWEDGCSLNVCNGEQLERIEELQANLKGDKGK